MAVAVPDEGESRDTVRLHDKDEVAPRTFPTSSPSPCPWTPHSHPLFLSLSSRRTP